MAIEIKELHIQLNLVPTETKPETTTPAEPGVAMENLVRETAKEVIRILKEQKER